MPIGQVAGRGQHLRLALAMPLLSLALLSMVFGLGRTAVLGNTSLGFVNLLHLALELVRSVGYRFGQSRWAG